MMTIAINVGKAVGWKFILESYQTVCRFDENRFLDGDPLLRGERFPQAFKRS
jgi:hypothetical protein